ncbi:hypothetical protein [Mesorhizobium sp. dw_380]|uniref:hypothetical protein n=1 Tax=Mesorhizobium sp. dw_380 TaxID=2812001 RepID=UPI001BDEB708|nr:hypothetical protein [Mesorhizobium sp. dw_380]
MQTAAGLLSALDDSIEAIKAHLATIDEGKLEALLACMPSRSTAGSAEMVMLIHLYRQIQTRQRDNNVLPFPAKKSGPNP